MPKPIVFRAFRDVLCFTLGSLIALGRRPDLSSLTSQHVVVGIPFAVAPQTPQIDVHEPAPDIGAPTAQCKAALQECRAAALRNAHANKEKQKRKMKVSSSLGSTNRHVVEVETKPVLKKCSGRPGPPGSMDPCYPNRAIEGEMQKHGRWVVDSIAYLQGFAVGGNEAGHRGSGADSKHVTLVVLTVNRAVPYLAVLLASLLRGHDPATLGKYVDLHVINIERRPCRCNYRLLSDLEEKLPFVTFHDWTEAYPQHSNITDSLQLYKSNQCLDYIRVLELCMEKGLKWCLVMEDDAIATSNLVPKFMDLTVGVNETDLAVLALYVPYNDAFAKNRLTDEYAEKKYDEDVKATKYMDPDTLGGPSPRIRYRAEDLSKVTYGVVANAYPSAQLRRMVQHLGRDDSRTAAYTDVEIMNKFAAPESGLRRMGVSPSLVNHVGHYSEHRADRSSMFNWFSTDVRFQL